MITARLDHLALDVTDRARAAAFYGDLLGARVVAEDPHHYITFLRLPGSDSYADVALHGNPDCAAAYPAGHMRLAHAGFRVTSPRDLVAAHDFFAARTRVVMAADFGVAWSVMGLDPDGHVVEVELFHAAAAEDAPGFAPLDVEALRAVSAEA